jgi:cytoskeletal protein CcmA (bactofilin family)
LSLAARSRERRSRAIEALTLRIAGDRLPGARRIFMPEKEPCLIGSKVTVKGSISGSEDLVVYGRVEGRVGLEKGLTIEEEGAVQADVEVTEATVKGELRGEVVASKSAVLLPTARVVGNIRAPRIVIEDGARFSGTIEMDVELPPGVKEGSA